MNVLSEADLKGFSLLSIGQPGVGKTVFLAGSYVELRSDSQPNNSEAIWFDSCDRQTQANLENLLDSIARTRQYPPPTDKSAAFNFALKRAPSAAQTLCHFRWQDVPGNRCKIGNPDFQTAILQSHGCCTFVSADALEREPAYLKQLNDIIEQVVAIAALAGQHRLIYPIAIILTQCDRLEDSQIRTLPFKLKPLRDRLEAVKAQYKCFSSAIPISRGLEPSGSAAPLVWLLSEITLGSVGPQQNLGNGLRKSLTNRQTLWDFDRVLSSTERRYMSVLAFANTSLQALPMMESLVQQEPNNLEWHFDLARLYESRGQKHRAETVYDCILTQQENNTKALIAKAMLRQEQGDSELAKGLLRQAQKSAPTPELKAKINLIAQKSLEPPRLTDNQA